MSASAIAAQQLRIRELLASNLYDTKILSELENNVRFQITSGSYDPESNRALLKLYTFAPDSIALDVLTRLLVKALMHLPSPDFFTSMYQIAERLHTLEPIKFLLKLNSLLEQCQFKKYHSDLAQFRANAQNAAIINFAQVLNYDEQIREFITLTVSNTYSSIATSQLKELWNLSEKKAFDDLVASSGFSFADDGKTVVIRSAPLVAANNSSVVPTKAQEYPSMEALAKLITRA